MGEVFSGETHMQGEDIPEQSNMAASAVVLEGPGPTFLDWSSLVIRLNRVSYVPGQVPDGICPGKGAAQTECATLLVS